jgi:hypothetical protein
MQSKDREHTHTSAPVTRIQTQTYAYCTRHPANKRIESFNEQGLLSWCKVCHCEVLISWEELDQIRAVLRPQERVTA